MKVNKGGHDGVKLTPPTDAEEAAIHEMLDEFAVRVNQRGQGRHLHIPSHVYDDSVDPDEDEPRPLCIGKEQTAYKLKDTAVFPVGYHPVCTDCTVMWRREDDT